MILSRHTRAEHRLGLKENFELRRNEAVGELDLHLICFLE